MVIAATKYDAFKNADAELKKVMSRTLRFLAHTHAAGLFYLGGLRGGAKSSPADAAGDDPASDRSQLNQFRAYLNHLIFTGVDKKFPARLNVETDHLKPILCPIGSDRLQAIGVPRGGGGGGGGGDDALQAWRDVFHQMFPEPPGGLGSWAGNGFKAPVGGVGGGKGVGGGGGDADRGLGGPDLARYPEHEVDAVRKQRNAELEQFRKQQAMLRSSPAAAAAGGALKAKAAAKKVAAA